MVREPQKVREPIHAGPGLLPTDMQMLLGSMKKMPAGKSALTLRTAQHGWRALTVMPTQAGAATRCCTRDPEADKWKQASFNFYDKRLLGGGWMSQQDPELIKQFCRILAVCHTAIPDGEQASAVVDCTRS